MSTYMCGCMCEPTGRRSFERRPCKLHAKYFRLSDDGKKIAFTCATHERQDWPHLTWIEIGLANMDRQFLDAYIERTEQYRQECINQIGAWRVELATVRSDLIMAEGIKSNLKRKPSETLQRSDRDKPESDDESDDVPAE